MVIPTEQRFSHYHHELTRCSFNQTQGLIEIQLDIPIKHMHEKIAEIFILPFYHKTSPGIAQICHVKHSHDFLIIKTQIPFGRHKSL